MIKKKYELIENGITYDSWDGCREGLQKAYEQAEQIINDGTEHLTELSIVCTHYNELGGIEYCEFVDEWDMEDMTCIDDRMIT
tara:strand:+ start:92 stop:340 length:249 start_codon:yes stop_codon:yes gene_type:complete